MSKQHQSQLPQPMDMADQGALQPAPHEDLNDPIQQTLLAICDQESARTAGWQVILPADTGQTWVHLINIGRRPPQQGWKLHISASAWSAQDVLQRTLPILLAEDAHFKVAATIRQLRRLNYGFKGVTQVGKFITVYPHDDAQAVRLAVALDQATQGLRSPRVPSDRQLRPGSLISYRYGGFAHIFVYNATGGVVPAIETPSGEFVPDVRRLRYDAPAWVTNPFPAAIAPVASSASRLIGQRYMIVSQLHHSVRGGIYLAVDTITPRSCVLKRAIQNALLDLDGQDARDHLRREAQVLAALAPDSRFPAVYDLLEHDRDLWLAMEELSGQTLEMHIHALAEQGRFLSERQVVAWGRDVCAMLEAIHQRGFIYRDLKSPNVFVSSDGSLQMIDFELAIHIGAEVVTSDLGTRGYMSSQQIEGHQATLSDDLYALGALLFFMATRAEPSLAPDPCNLLSRSLTLLNPAIGVALQQVIATCLAQDPSERYNSVAAVDAALAQIVDAVETRPPMFGVAVIAADERAPHVYRDLAYRLGTTLASAARRDERGTGVFWLSTYSLESGIPARDLYHGTSGVMLALAELVAVFDEPGWRRVLHEAAQWLMAGNGPHGQPQAGLYVGEAGVGATLLRAGQVLGQDELIAAAVERGAWVAAQPHTSPDMTIGTAGRLRFHLLLWDATHDPRHVRAAIAAGEQLLAVAEETDQVGLCWRQPPIFDSDASGTGRGQSNGPASRGHTYLGYAHGAAGIADALLDLFSVTNDERFLNAAARAGRWLESQAFAVLDDGSGLNWPRNESQAHLLPYWCHGATGIGTFFLHASQLGALPQAAGLADKAARTIARSARWTGIAQCHGLTSNIDLLLDMFQATRQSTYLNEAYVLAHLLRSCAVERKGLLFWPSAVPNVFTPDYMVGYAGVAVCLLRLIDPERVPAQLSRRGFQYRAAAGGSESLN